MELIRARRKRLHLSYERAGALVPGGLSDTRWRNLEDGFRTVKGAGRIPESAPALTLAGMAYVVGVTPAELHAHGRHDAADELLALISSRAQGDGEVLAEAAQMAGVARGLNAQQRKTLESEIAADLRRIREQA
jgi:hypothetical protein